MLSYDSLNASEAPSGTPSASNSLFCKTFFRPFVSRPRCARAARRSFTGIFMTSIGCVGSGFLSLSGTISGFGALVPSLSVMEPRTGVAVSAAIFRGFAENFGFALRPRLKETPKLPPSTDGVAGVAGAGGGVSQAFPYLRAPLLSTETGSARSGISLPSSSRCLHKGFKGVRGRDEDSLRGFTLAHNRSAASSTGSGHLSKRPGCT